jgi:hypothetical protein
MVTRKKQTLPQPPTVLMVGRKKKKKTFPYCNYGNKKKTNPTPTTYCTYDNTKK